MTTENKFRWVSRTVWPLLGGAWCAWILFRGPYSRISHMNTDTLAPVAVWYFIIFSAIIGLAAGAALCALTGRIVDWFRRRLGFSVIAAIGAVTLINVLMLWQISTFLQAKYPGLRVEITSKRHRSIAHETLTPVDKGTYRNSCLDPPPTDTKERALWYAECR